MIRVKICGITNRGDALMAAEYGTDAVGVVNVEESKRFVDLEKAREIFTSLPVFISKVVVAAPDSIKEALELTKSGAGYIQLHGNESRDFVKTLRKKTGIKIIKKISVDKNCIENSGRYAEIADAILLDTETKGLSGGTGVTHDWGVSKKVVCSINTQAILAGGLNTGNVKEAIDAVKPYAVDASSGVESRPGKKDLEKLKEFIKIAKSK
ncbi:MAG: N-(5'-phosphoribosyl)anthranilate isomerase [Candidatus Altiarchaeales archaeon ex4484_2]|nr:MAG: N-(5'-phosphoribosyl)anthranilate isomerase [Candidatus Altiarchaeales archaeon ex4484_2]